MQSAATRGGVASCSERAQCPLQRRAKSSQRAAAHGQHSRSQARSSRLQQAYSLTKHAEEREAGSQDASAVSARPRPAPRFSLRMGLPSKGRMAEDTMTLLKESALSVYKPNPRQYVASIPQIPGVEVWFQRASDVVRKLAYGDIDLGIVGTDMYAELADGDSDLVVCHEALDFGQCKLALGVPMGGKFAAVESIEQLRTMPNWTRDTPLRVVTGYHNVARKFFREKGFNHIMLLSADGALEAAPAMGSADIILDLVSTGVTLRENNLKEIKGGDVLESQGILVANKKSLLNRPGLLKVVHELIERFDAHLKAEQFYHVIANMRGSSPEEVAQLLAQASNLQGLQGPTISPVYNLPSNGSQVVEVHTFYAVTICVRKKQLYTAIKTLQKLGGSGVLVQPMTYIFDEEPLRWRQLLEKLGLNTNLEPSHTQ